MPATLFGHAGGPGRVGRAVEEGRAHRLVDGLRALGVDAHVERPGVYAFGVAVQLPDGRRAVWGADTGLSATVVRDGVLVGFVPALPDGLPDDAAVATIARTDYDAPPGARRERGLPAGPPLPVRRGLFARVRPGLRW